MDVETYDYIIIGTGPAASVILNNLVKKKNCGAFFQWNNSESLKFSLENFIKNYQHFNEKSIIASRDWHKSEGIKKFCRFIAVSYTHLTLPTILLV